MPKSSEKLDSKLKHFKPWPESNLRRGKQTGITYTINWLNNATLVFFLTRSLFSICLSCFTVSFVAHGNRLSFARDCRLIVAGSKGTNLTLKNFFK